MQNKVLTFALVVIVGVSLGVIVVSRQPAGSKMDLLAQQQAENTRVLKAIEQGINSAGKNNQDLSSVLVSVQDLQRRMAALESKVAAAAAAPAAQRNPQMPPDEDFAKAYDIPVGNSYISGPKDAPVSITEFVDFQCPFCARFHPPIVEILKTYPNDVNYVIKNFPLSFHPNARPAAKAALAAGEQGKYWEMVDLILADNSQLSDDKYLEFAKKIGLNTDKFSKDIKANNDAWDKLLDDDIALGGQVDVRGTPTFFMNGHKTMSRDTAGLKREIDAILKK